MKAASIRVGDILFDGKSGIREVKDISLDGAGILRAKYRILSAVQSNKVSPESGKKESAIGTISSCHLEGLATWAKKRLTREKAEALALELSARRLRLSVGEVHLISDTVVEYDAIEVWQPGIGISIEDEKLRQAKGLAKKGLGQMNGQDELILNELGAKAFTLARDRINKLHGIKVKKAIK